MSVAPIGGEYERRAFALRLSLDPIHCRPTNRSELLSAFGVREVHAMLFGIHPGALQSQDFHAPKASQEHEADGRQPCWVLPFLEALAHGPTQSG